MKFPDKKYKIIYADPPWSYSVYSNDRTLFRGKRSKFGVTPYKPMSLEEIKALPISEFADKDSVLCMWITYPCLEWLTPVLESWGFKYVTVLFTWVKKNKSGVGWFHGLGNYTMANAEICILARKGKGVTVQTKNISQIIDSPLTTHSKKPNIVRDKIVKLFGDLPRIELFARTKVHGWDVWGNDEKLKLEPLEAYL